LLIDLVSAAGRPRYFNSASPVPHAAVVPTMDRVGRHLQALTDRALRAVSAIDGVTVYGPPLGEHRAPLVAFNVSDLSPFAVAEALDRQGIEARAGCHCATLAHRELGLDPPASCRLSFYLYNTTSDVDRAVAAVARIAGSRVRALSGRGVR
jgi:cysteine desulfurase/selenocysteine lyase